jgi:hypothetical protein
MMPENGGEHAIAKQVWHLVPVSNGVQTLQRGIVRVVGRFASLPGPFQQCRPQAVAHFLRLFVEPLLCRLFPGEAQVAGHGDQPQTHGAAGGQMQRARIAIATVPVEV